MTEANRKFLVIVDDTQECARALLFAARRAERTRGTVLALSIQPEQEFQHWLGVENLMREEAEAEAQMLMDKVIASLDGQINTEVERRVLFGSRTEVIRNVIQDESTIAQLILAAAQGSEGPGPLVSAIGSQAGGYLVPITIVPGALSDEAVNALA